MPQQNTKPTFSHLSPQPEDTPDILKAKAFIRGEYQPEPGELGAMVTAVIGDRSNFVAQLALVHGVLENVLATFSEVYCKDKAETLGDVRAMLQDVNNLLEARE